MTLAELMIAVALIGIGVLVSAKAFTGIQRAIQYSKGKTIATNVAQEKMQILMQKSYYEVLVTTMPAFKVEPSTIIYYDVGFYPPETLPEGGMTFTRYTYIQQIQENSGVIQVLAPDSGDTGIRQITVSVVWQTDSGDKVLSIKNVLNNPNTVMANAYLNGVVKDSVTLSGIPNALVNAAENIGWRDSTDNLGNYHVSFVAGSFNFQASAPGYFSKIIPVTIGANATQNLPFFLIPISSGTIKGAVWLDNHLVISQVVASTGPAQDIEYVELYNATTSPINIAQDPVNFIPAIWPMVRTADAEFGRHLVFISTYVRPTSFYLISNTNDGSNAICTPFVAVGLTVQPDACWRYTLRPNHAIEPPLGSGIAGGILTTPNAGGIALATTNTTPLNPANRIDSIGWNGTSGAADPNYVETTAFSPTTGTGMLPGVAFVRRLDTSTAWNTAYGNAYDTNTNSWDFIEWNPLPFPPRNSAIQRAPLTGTPATGAIVSVIDGLSAPSSATLTGNPPYAQFSAPGVATGTWIVFIDSGAASAEIDNLAVTANATVLVPNAATVPPWTFVGSNNIVLNTSGVVGMVNGKITDALGIPLAGITVTAGYNGTTSGVNGTYYIRLSTGIFDVVANGGNANASYASAIQPAVTVSLGDMTSSVNFTLPKGGKINGWISRDGINPLPGVTVVAFDINGIAQDSEVSGNNGQFLLINLATGPYTVQPSLDTKETSNPASAPTTVVAGATVWSSSFTVLGAMGSVTGKVMVGGNPIKSGVLIVVSTGTIPIPLPALSSNTLTAAAYYADSSKEDGTYSVDVRGSTTSVYNMVGFYMTLNGQIPAISTQTITGITVNAGLPTPGVNFLW